MSNKVDHYMPLWIADYLADTTRLTTEQHGAYLLLLMDYWRNGPPPANDEVLAQIAKLDKKKWTKNKPILMNFFEQKNGSLIHKRVEKELKKSRDKKEANIERAKAGAEARWGKSIDANSNAKSMKESNALSIDQEEPEAPYKQSSKDAILELRTHSLTKESSSSPPISPQGEHAAAASSGIKNQNPEGMDIEDVIERIVKIRIESAKRNNRPVKNPLTLKQSLKAAYRKNPQEELDVWLEQIAFDDEQESKREEQRRLAEEKALKDQKEQEKIEMEKAEIQRVMDVYETLDQETKKELWDTATDLEKRQLPDGLKPFDPMVKRRVVRMMKEQGYVD